MGWTFAGSLALFAVALLYLVAKLWRPFDAGGRTRPLWSRKAR